MHILNKIARNIKKRRDDWEALCKKCGICCFGKESKLFRTTIMLSQPCEYFDRQTKLCKVYDTRLKTCHYCAKVTIFHALFSNALPATCGYVERYRQWRIARDAEIKV
jgi:uncharacterized cysteine cluster protein YcgN (CxxCxxCC family)